MADSIAPLWPQDVTETVVHDGARSPNVGAAAVSQCVDLSGIADSCKAALGGA